MLLYEELSNEILESMNTVHRNVGPGLVERIYEGALSIELNLRGIKFIRQKPFRYHYKGYYVGTYYADMIVEDKIIIELKAVQELNKVMEAQLLNYLGLAHLKVGYLVNFKNTSLKFKRFIL